MSQFAKINSTFANSHATYASCELRPMHDVLHLFPVIDHLLITLLRSLNDEAWDKPTIAPLWTVKDIAAHLLDTAMRSVSMYRDQHSGEKPGNISSYSDLVGYLNRLNGDWVSAFRRVSHRQITELLESASASQFKLLSQLDPSAPAMFSVAWAGEERSTNAFHIAREYSEKFHHQIQIREAVSGTDALLTQELFHPFMETLLQGLPHAYRDTDAPDGTGVQITILSDAGGSWSLMKAGRWKLVAGEMPGPAAQITMTPTMAWKLFTKGMTIAEALVQLNLQGDRQLAMPCLGMVAVMAVR